MLHVDHIFFSYDETPILEDVSLIAGKGQNVAIMGASGCGKSTLLKIIYGLLHIEQGKVSWEDQPVLGPNFSLVPGEPYMKYLAQDFDLMPFTTVSENIGKFLSVLEPEKTQARIEELLQIIEMQEFANTKVRFLSGGQQQRVALARVLAQQPEVLLLDEPFGHIDHFLKNRLRRNLYNYLKRNNITCITATHDVNDVLPFADKVCILRDRQFVAKGTPMELYQNPQDIYIASLFGEANRIPINVVKSYANTKRRIIVYSHEFRVSQQSGFQVAVTRNYPMGDHYLVEADSEAGKVFFDSKHEIQPKTEVFLNVSIETLNQRLKP